MSMLLYAAASKKTGKLVSDITNPRRKYWDRQKNAQNAINKYNKYHNEEDQVELAVFELVEVK